jgi:DNA segregation ATPase FtsK/SpoIIIE, S-DNA-T family
MTYCEECGFVYSQLSVGEIPPALRALGPSFGHRLARDPDALRAHPDPRVWSALEYCCHVRDVLDVQRERLALALRDDCPVYTPMGRDERVTRDRYNEQDPTTVAAQLSAAARAAADAFAALSADEWPRTGIYNYPAPAERTMVWLGRHTVHEGHHHLRDVDAALTRAQG